MPLEGVEARTGNTATVISPPKQGDSSFTLQASGPVGAAAGQNASQTGLGEVTKRTIDDTTADNDNKRARLDSSPGRSTASLEQHHRPGEIKAATENLISKASGDTSQADQENVKAMSVGGSAGLNQ